MLCTHMMAGLGGGKEDAGNGGRGIQGRTRDYISEQAGEADLIQVWDFALTPRGCVGRPAWYCVNKPSRAEFTCGIVQGPVCRASEVGGWANVARWGASMTRHEARRQLSDDDRWVRLRFRGSRTTMRSAARWKPG